MSRITQLRAATALAAGAFVMVAVAACDDKPQHPTAPSDATAAVVTASAPVDGAGVSTVCLAYMTKQSVAREKLADLEKGQSPASARESLEKRVEKLDAMVADVCQ